MLEILLSDPGKFPLVGPERGKKVHDGISKYVAPGGSYRYVRYIDGVAVAALQVMSRDGKAGQAANVYTHPEFRRKGYASELWRKAQRDFKTLVQAPESDRSQAGMAWSHAVRSGSMTLYQRIVKLAYHNPDLRGDLLPLVKKAQGEWGHEKVKEQFQAQVDKVDGFLKKHKKVLDQFEKLDKSIDLKKAVRQLDDVVKQVKKKYSDPLDIEDELGKWTDIQVGDFTISPKTLYSERRLSVKDGASPKEWLDSYKDFLVEDVAKERGVDYEDLSAMESDLREIEKLPGLGKLKGKHFESVGKIKDLKGKLPEYKKALSGEGPIPKETESWAKSESSKLREQEKAEAKKRLDKTRSKHKERVDQKKTDKAKAKTERNERVQKKKKERDESIGKSQQARNKLEVARLRKDLNKVREKANRFLDRRDGDLSGTTFLMENVEIYGDKTHGRSSVENYLAYLEDDLDRFENGRGNLKDIKSNMASLTSGLDKQIGKAEAQIEAHKKKTKEKHKGQKKIDPGKTKFDMDKIHGQIATAFKDTAGPFKRDLLNLYDDLGKTDEDEANYAVADKGIVEKFFDVSAYEAPDGTQIISLKSKKGFPAHNIQIEQDAKGKQTTYVNKKKVDAPSKGMSGFT